MRSALLVLGLVATLAAPAHADMEWCFPYEGPVLPDGSVVPPRPRLAFYTTVGHETDKLTATIDGKPVQVTRSTARPLNFFLVTAVIESDRTGDLVVTFGARPPLRYTVSSAALPTEVPATVGRATGRLGSDEQEFNGLAIRLPEGTPALLAHVRHRDAPDQPWHALDVPLYTPVADPRPAIRIGEFGCGDRNASLAILARGFELEVTVTLADATVVPVTGLAKRMTLPEALPPQPRPRNARR
jgi:hypothetical protein